MKIKEIYKSGGHPFISWIMAALCIAVTLLTAFLPDIYTSLTYAYPLKYPWQLLSGIFVHGSPNMDTAATIGHLGFNLLLLLPFGIMIEKIIGSKKYAVLFGCVWLINAVTFFVNAIIVTPEGEHSYGAGISGIAFGFGFIGLYILFKLFMQDKKAALKQISFYLLLNIVIIMLVMINPIVAGVSSMIMHLVSVICGAVYLIFFHKDIDNFMSGRK